MRKPGEVCVVRDTPSLRVTASLMRAELAARNRTLDRLHSAIEKQLASSSHRIDEAGRRGDQSFALAVIDDECERIEQLLGLSFVAAQVFITTVRSRIAKLSDVCSKDAGTGLSFVTTPKAHEVMKAGQQMERGIGYSDIEIINAVANHWKHQEEWPIRFYPEEDILEPLWDSECMRSTERKTVEIVAAVGMTPHTTGNLRAACEALGIVRYEDLSPIREKLYRWAQNLCEMARSELASHRPR